MHTGSLTLTIFTLAILIVAGVGGGHLVHRRYRRKSLDDEDLTLFNEDFQSVGNEMRAQFEHYLRVGAPWILERSKIESSVERINAGRRFWKRRKRIVFTITLSLERDLPTVQTIVAETKDDYLTRPENGRIRVREVYVSTTEGKVSHGTTDSIEERSAGANTGTSAATSVRNESEAPA